MKIYTYYKDTEIKLDGGWFRHRNFNTFSSPWSDEMKKMFPEFIGPFESEIDVKELGPNRNYQNKD